MGNYLSPLNTKLDADQVLRRAYDETSNRLRVDAEVTATIGTIEVFLDAATSSVAIGDGTDILNVNPDGTINVNVASIVISHTDDSIKIGDGVDFLSINADGSINSVVSANNLDIRDLNYSTDSVTSRIQDSSGNSITSAAGALSVSDSALTTTNSSLSSIDGKITTTIDGIRVDGSAVTQPVSVVSLPLPTGAATETTLFALNNKVTTSVDGIMVDAKINNLPSDYAKETTVSSIDNKLNTLGQKNSAGSVPVVLASDQSIIPVTATLDEPIKMSGTKDGQPSGTEYTFVNNERSQILAAHDRQSIITYADFGTKDQRVTRIDYTSATFPAIIVRKDFIYILDGNRYKRTDINWSII